MKNVGKRRKGKVYAGIDVYIAISASGQKLTLAVSPRDTVGVLKDLLYQTNGIPVSRQVLFFFFFKVCQDVI